MTTAAPAPATYASAVEYLAPHWPPPASRNGAYLALEGGLLNDGLTVEQAAEIIRALVEAVGGGDADARAAEVDRTKRRKDAGKNCTGWPRLAGLIGEEVVGQFRRLLGTATCVEQLARHKRLPECVLRDLGLRDLPMGGVEIPYRDRAGKEVLAKKRRGLSAKTSLWPKGTPPLCYGEDRLDDAVDAGHLILVEGESDCWAGWFHGLPVLGIPGANAVDQALTLGLVASVPRLYAVQEPGGGGEDFIRNLRATLARLGWEGELRVVRLPAKDLSDLHCSDPGSFLAKWQDAVAESEPIEVKDGAAAAGEPDAPPPTEPPWPDPPCEEAFHGLGGKIVRAIEPASEADPAAVLVQTLTAFGNVIGRGAYFSVEADRHHGNEFVVLVGRTSKARKGTSWGHVDRLMREAKGQWAEERVQGGASSGEGVIWAVRDPIMKREKVKERGQPVRYEEVEADPGIADKRLLMYEPEFATVLKQTERQGNTLSVIFRQAWDGRPTLRSMTKNSPAVSTGAHISVVGHITADELRRYLTATETANGFANRFLLFCADRSKMLPEGGRVDPGVMAGLREELVEALAFARTAGEVRRDEEARVIPTLADLLP
jgi:hypothetical protein